MNSDSHQIQALKNRYKSSLSEKAETIGEHLEAVSDSDQVDITKLEIIRNDLHKFAGSSGMYGYDDIADIARNAMAIIDGHNIEQLHYKLIDLRDLLYEHANS